MHGQTKICLRLHFSFSFSHHESHAVYFNLKFKLRKIPGSLATAVLRDLDRDRTSIIPLDHPLLQLRRSRGAGPPRLEVRMVVMLSMLVSLLCYATQTVGHACQMPPRAGRRLS